MFLAHHLTGGGGGNETPPICPTYTFPPPPHTHCIYFFLGAAVGFRAVYQFTSFQMADFLPPQSLLCSPGYCPLYMVQSRRRSLSSPWQCSLICGVSSVVRLAAGPAHSAHMPCGSRFKSALLATESSGTVGQLPLPRGNYNGQGLSILYCPKGIIDFPR